MLKVHMVQIRLHALDAWLPAPDTVGPPMRTAGPDVERSPVQGTQACGSSRV